MPRQQKVTGLRSWSLGRTTAVAVVLLFTVLGSSCGVIGSGDEPDAAGDLEAIAGTVLAFGESVTLPTAMWAADLIDRGLAPPTGTDVTVTFLGAEQVDSLPDQTFASGTAVPIGRWLVVRYSFTNNLDEDVVPSTDFNGRLFLRDGTDRRWKRNATHEENAALSGGYTPPVVPVEPGGTVETVVLFDVPPGATGLHLISEPLDFVLGLGLDDGE